MLLFWFTAWLPHFHRLPRVNKSTTRHRFGDGSGTARARRRRSPVLPVLTGPSLGAHEGAEERRHVLTERRVCDGRARPAQRRVTYLGRREQRSGVSGVWPCSPRFPDDGAPRQLCSGYHKHSGACLMCTVCFLEHAPLPAVEPVLSRATPGVSPGRGERCPQRQ